MSLDRSHKTATVVVIGDIGRSPRMQYHCYSLLQNGFKVNIIGYMETSPLAELVANEDFKVISLQQPPELSLPSLLKYLFKCIWISLTLWWALLKCIIFEKSHLLLYQNPPAVPGLFVIYTVCIFRSCPVILDWHNYSHSILALSLPKRHILVRLTRKIEYAFGRLSNSNFCVTKAMQDDLKTHHEITATVLYDRPFSKFKPISLGEKHKLFMKLSEIYPDLRQGPESTVFTFKNKIGIIESNRSRSAMIVSSTSWTTDEDFGILLTALESKYEVIRIAIIIYNPLVGTGPFVCFSIG